MASYKTRPIRGLLYWCELGQKLYLPGGQTYSGCRHCYNLTYQSSQEHDDRVNSLMRLPPAELEKLLSNKDPKAALLGVKAWFKMLDKIR